MTVLKNEQHTFHCLWLYDLCVEMDKNLPDDAEEVEFKIQYEECGIFDGTDENKWFILENTSIGDFLEWMDYMGFHSGVQSAEGNYEYIERE